jgi:hypothetical protein
MHCIIQPTCRTSNNTPQNKGASQHALAAETTQEVTGQLLDLNALGPIALTRAALPLMLQRKK